MAGERAMRVHFLSQQLYRKRRVPGSAKCYKNQLIIVESCNNATYGEVGEI